MERGGRKTVRPWEDETEIVASGHGNCHTGELLPALVACVRLVQDLTVFKGFF